MNRSGDEDGAEKSEESCFHEHRSFVTGGCTRHPFRHHGGGEAGGCPKESHRIFASADERDCSECFISLYHSSREIDLSFTIGRVKNLKKPAHKKKENES